MKKLCLIITVIFAFGMIPLGLSLAGIIECDYHCDFTSQEIPFIYGFKHMLESGAPWWDWNTYLGDNFVAGYSYYGLFSPFNWLCCIFPYKYLNLGIFISIYLKTLFTGLFAAVYLRRMKVSENMVILGGLLYTFSSFYIINLFYGMFCEAIMIYPLLLACIENVLDRRRYSIVLLALVTFATVTVQYYFAVASLMCAGIYLLCRVLFDRQYRSTRSLMVPIAAILYGIVMSSIVLFPTAMHIMGGNRDAYKEPLGNMLSMISWVIYHIFWTVVPKVAESNPQSFPYSCLNNTSLFLQVTGISFAIIYAIKRHSWLTACLIVYTIFYLTPLNGIFTLFTKLSYCRWLYCFILMLILATAKCIDKKLYSKKDLNTYIILTIGFILFCVCLSFYFSKSVSLNSRQITELVLGGINLLLLYWLTRSEKRTSRFMLPSVAASSLLNLTIFVAMLSGSYPGFRTNNNLLRKYIVDNSLIMQPHNLSYRCDYINTQHPNLAILYGTPAISCFHSLFNKNIIDFTEYLKDGAISAMSYPVKTPRESLAALLSVKDVIRLRTGVGEDSDYNFGLTLMEKSDQQTSYTFDYHIPMGMVYKSYVTRSQLDSLRSNDKNADLCLMMLDNIVIEDNDEAEIGKVLRKSAINTTVTLDSITDIRRRHTTDFKGNSKGYTVETREDTPAGMIFVSTPCDDGFTATIDGKPTKLYKVNMGMSGLLVPGGRHLIEVTYLVPGLKLGAIISGICAMILISLFVINTYKSSLIKNRNL